MRSSTGKTSFIIIFFTIVCVILMIVGIALFVSPIVKKGRCTETVTAVVVDEIITHSDRKDGNGYRTVSDYHSPVFSYNYNGREYTVKSNEGSDPPRYNIGDSTELMIDPSDPEYFYDPSSHVALVLGVIFGSLGLVGTAIFLALLLKKN